MSVISRLARLSLILSVSLALAKVDQRHINHKSNNELEIVLPSNLSTSYAWLPYQYNEEEIKSIESDYERTGVEIGGGGYQHWKINFAEGVRETTISFVYMPQHLFPAADVSDYDQAIYHIHITD